MSTTVYCDLSDCIHCINGVCNQQFITFNYSDMYDYEICENFEGEGEYDN